MGERETNEHGVEAAEQKTTVVHNQRDDRLMTVISRGTLDGHEARADVAIVVAGDAAHVQLRNLWIAPGAPDVRLYVSPRTDGKVDETATDLGKLVDGLTGVTRGLPDHIDPASVGSVIVHCTVYSELFGFGTLTARSSPG